MQACKAVVAIRGTQLLVLVEALEAHAKILDTLAACPELPTERTNVMRSQAETARRMMMTFADSVTDLGLSVFVGGSQAG